MPPSTPVLTILYNYEQATLRIIGLALYEIDDKRRRTSRNLPEMPNGRKSEIGAPGERSSFSERLLLYPVDP
jgi:hypothetical protein